MQVAHTANRKLLTLAAFGVSMALGSTIAVGVLSGASSAATRVIPRTITASLITRTPGTLAPGTRVRSGSLGERVFPNGRTGFALASVGQVQYPAATVNGGTTWRTDGPALHLNAAQAPLVVVFPGAANTRTFFAFGGGQVVDATGDAGRHWWRAFLGDAVIAVVPRLGGGLVAFAQDVSSTGNSAVTLVYVSRDGGHHWRYTTNFGP